MKIRIIAAALAAFFMLPLLGTVAYAGGGDYIPGEEQPVQEAPAETPTIPATEGPVVTETEANPFTPAGTATVIDYATDADGKQFYTIMTPAENVFYLVIDRQRETENVYFLNAVTEADLLALAEIELPTAPDPAPTITEQPTAPTEPEPTPEQTTEQGGGNMGMIILVVAVVLGGGGAGYYFKIYRPKQQQADNEEDYSADGPDPYGGDEEDAEPEDDGPPWYDEDEEPGGDGEA